VETEEHQRLVEARRRASADDDRWLGMLRRLGDQFPENGAITRGQRRAPLMRS
jgi:hypothetical protein